MAKAQARDNLHLCVEHLIEREIISERPDMLELVAGCPHEMLSVMNGLRRWEQRSKGIRHSNLERAEELLTEVSHRSIAFGV